MKMHLVLAVSIAFAVTVSACGPAQPRPANTPEASASPMPVPTQTSIPSPAPSPTENEQGWDYVALGDSNPGGAGVSRSYADIFAKDIARDLGVEVRLHNWAFDGATSARLLAKLNADTELQQDIREAEIVTIDIGANDWTSVAHRYPKQECGGADNQDCLRELIQAYSGNFDAILDELESLHGEAPRIIIRAVDLYLSDCDFPNLHEDPALFQGIKPYLDEFNGYIQQATQARGGQVAPLYRTFNGPTGAENPVKYLQSDQCHLNPGGHQAVAEMLRKLGYEQ
jgi:lysophospholipase L1-like esterase